MQNILIQKILSKANIDTNHKQKDEHNVNYHPFTQHPYTKIDSMIYFEEIMPFITIAINYL